MSEYIYIMSNPSMPGLLKVGRSDNPDRRSQELSAHTGVPTPFFVERAVEVADSEYAERDAHDILCRYRVSFVREFFRCDLAEAIAAIDVAKKVDKSRLEQATKFAQWIMARTDLNELPTII